MRQFSLVISCLIVLVLELTVTVSCTEHDCPIDLWLCHNTSKFTPQCINQNWVCDGGRDCEDGSDELNCDQSCKHDQWKCQNTSDCIHQRWRCDGEEDCVDGSDEMGCTSPQRRCANEEWQCHNSSQSHIVCIDRNWVCDGSEDCEDGSDEMECSEPLCTSVEFKCHSSTSVPRCINQSWRCDGDMDCGDGSDELGCDNKSCVSDEGTCGDNVCIKSSFFCDGYAHCQHGLDEKNCTLSDQDMELVFSNVQDLRRYNLFNGSYSQLMKMNVSRATALDFDYRNNKIYGTDIVPSYQIYQANMDGSDFKILIEDVGGSGGLAVDWVHGNLYFSDEKSHKIEVSRLDGRFRKILINQSIDLPRTLAVDPYKGWLYWADWGDEPRIEKCGMNGRARKAIVTKDIGWVNGITIDYTELRLYWVDAKLDSISSVRLDGTDRRVVMESDSYLGHPFDITMFGDMLYWTDWRAHAVYKASKLDGNSFIPVVKSLSNTPMGICAVHQLRQPIVINHCGANNGGCSHLCLPKPVKDVSNSNKIYVEVVPRYTCACPDGMKLDGKYNCIDEGDNQTSCASDEETCGDVCIKSSFFCDGYAHCQHGLDEKNCTSNDQDMELIFSNLQDLRRYDLLDDNYTRLLEMNVTRATALDFDYRNNKIYGTDIESNYHIYQANMDGSDFRILIEDVGGTGGLAVDWVHGNLYFSDGKSHKIEVSRLNGSFRKILINQSIDQPRTLAVDPYKGWIYWADWGDEPRIEKCGMNGRARKAIVTKDLGWANGITIDYIELRLYWVDARLDSISSVRLDGTDRRLILKNDSYLRHPFDITVFDELLYWTDWMTRSVYKASKLDGSNFLPVVSGLRQPMGICALHQLRQPIVINHCGPNNGGCSHLCLPKPVKDVPNSNNTYVEVVPRYTCACPDGMKLDGKYNCIDEDAETNRTNISPYGSKRKRPAVITRPDNQTEQNTTEMNVNTTSKAEVSTSHDLSQNQLQLLDFSPGRNWTFQSFVQGFLEMERVTHQRRLEDMKKEHKARMRNLKLQKEILELTKELIQDRNCKGLSNNTHDSLLLGKMRA